MISERQKETAFLRRCLLYDDAGKCHNLAEGIAQARRDERCLCRAMWFMVVLIALSAANLCYAAILLTNHPQNTTQFVTPVINKIFCALGLGSLICLLAFAGLWMVYRKKLDRRREECRRLATKFFENRLSREEQGETIGKYG